MKTIPLTKRKTSEAIEQAVRILETGGIIIYPTETCYGVGVDATNEKAVEKLLLYKDRPEGKAISIAVSDKQMAEKYVIVNETANNLYKNFLPGPITVVSKSKGNVAEGIEAEDTSLGVRIPDYPFTLDLIKAFGKPITATSANRSGRKTPYSISDIKKNTSLKKWNLIDLIIDAGNLPKNPPSTVVDTRFSEGKILREGLFSNSKLQNPNAGLNSKFKNPFDHTQGKQKSKRQIKTSSSEKETQIIAEKLIKNLLSKLEKKCIIFALSGEMGAGKTQFAKGIANGLGIKETISSPTIILVREYKIEIAELLHSYIARNKDNTNQSTIHLSSHFLFHIDTWRMREEKELLDLGFYDMIKPGNVIVVEWMEKVKDILYSVSEISNVEVIWVAIEGEEKKREIVIQQIYQ